MLICVAFTPRMTPHVNMCCFCPSHDPPCYFLFFCQLGVVEGGHGEWSREEVCQVYVSLARTLEDCGQFSQALFFYNKEVSLLKDKPAEVGGAFQLWVGLLVV